MPLGLNQSCHCVSLDREALARHFESALLDAGSLPSLMQGREHLFAPYPVFASAGQLEAMRSVIAAVQEVIAIPGWREAALAGSSWPDQHTRGVLASFDFHPEEQGAKLIEINTNAGGAYLSALLSESQRACCSLAGETLLAPIRGRDQPGRWLADFRREWQLARGEQPLRRVLIVDDAPQQQFLFPEFLLFRQLLSSSDLQCAIADASELEFDGTSLRHLNEPVDMVYNRLTDFELREQQHSALREAYLADRVVLTPSPFHHALYADKRHLVRLSDEAWLTTIGVRAELRNVLAKHIPRARLVTVESADELWKQRKRLFFKPFAGYASRGAYRGESITRRVWAQILDSGNYIAQEFTPAPLRKGSPDEKAAALKFDLRCVTYGSELRLLSARLYEGQTTNLRSASGGLGSVLVPAVNVEVASAA